MPRKKGFPKSEEPTEPRRGAASDVVPADKRRSTEAPTLPPPAKQRDSMMRRKTKKPPIVEEVSADLSKDPRRED